MIKEISVRNAKCAMHSWSFNSGTGFFFEVFALG